MSTAVQEAGKIVCDQEQLKILVGVALVNGAIAGTSVAVGL
jgi:hypothetical protein